MAQVKPLTERERGMIVTLDKMLSDEMVNIQNLKDQLASAEKEHQDTWGRLKRIQSTCKHERKPDCGHCIACKKVL